MNYAKFKLKVLKMKLMGLVFEPLPIRFSDATDEALIVVTILVVVEVEEFDDFRPLGHILLVQTLVRLNSFWTAPTKVCYVHLVGAGGFETLTGLRIRPRSGHLRVDRLLARVGHLGSSTDRWHRADAPL